jgi:hypothetical protein
MAKTKQNTAVSEDKSPFTDKKNEPADEDLKVMLGSTFKAWERLSRHTMSAFPAAAGAWSYPSEKYGWSYRISDKKRVLIYLLPRNGYFKAGFVFGEKAFREIMESNVSKQIKDDLSSARVYGEGRGIRIEVRNLQGIKDLEKLIDIKIAN